MFDEEALAQLPNSEQSPYRGLVKEERQWLQPSALGHSGQSVSLTESRLMSESTSSSSLPLTKTWIETTGNLHMQKPSSVPPSGNQIPVSRIPIHLMQPIWKADNAPVNRVIIDYLSAARQQIAQGNAAVRMVNRGYIHVQAFFQRCNTPGLPTVSEWASEINRSSADVPTFVRLAKILLQTYLMRVSKFALLSISQANSGPSVDDPANIR